jgi:hypothetical protein
METTISNIPLTAGEIAPLWTGYQSDTMVKCVLQYFLNIVEDREIRTILEYAESLTNQHLRFMDELFKQEKFPKPVAFTEQDVNLRAPRLFSDEFMLQYIRQMGTAGVTAYSLALSSSARRDIREFYTQNLITTAELLNQAYDVLLSKGLFVRPPSIPTPETAEYVQKEGWLNGFFGDRRPINVVEITHVYLNHLTNGIGKALMIGFSQVAKSKDVADYIMRGRDIANKHIEVFASILRDDQLPASMTWEAEVSGTKEAPFSDKLMLFHTVSLIGIGLGNYGAAVTGSMRRDLATTYIRLTAEVGTYADDGAELLIDKGWLEKIPGAVERDTLVQA